MIGVEQGSKIFQDPLYHPKFTTGDHSGRGKWIERIESVWKGAPGLAIWWNHEILDI